MVLCWSTVAAPSGAVPLDPGTFFLETEINGRRKQEFGLGAASFINDEGHTSRSSGAAWDGFAGAVTSGGASPAAGFFAEGTAQGVPIPSGGFQGDQGMVSAHARLIYFARIVELDSLPVAVPQDALPLILPVTVRVIAQAHAEAHGLGNVAQALGSALVGGFFAGRVSALDAPGCAICQNVGDHRLDRDSSFHSWLAR
jgi:hypothetical protein